MAAYRPSFQPLAVVDQEGRERHVRRESAGQSVGRRALVGGRAAEARVVADGALLSDRQLLPAPRRLLCTDLRRLGHRRPKRHHTRKKLRTKSKLLRLGFCSPLMQLLCALCSPPDETELLTRPTFRCPSSMFIRSGLVHL